LLVVPQLLLFPDPRPLVERLGAEFFRQVPERAGVYLMRDATDAVLYVGKAKDLRKRLGSYRVANPDRLRRRQLRLLRAVQRIEIQQCADEPTALAKEAELLLQLRPKFNRAGTWPAISRFLAWRLTEEGLELAVPTTAETGWQFVGPLGTSAYGLRGILIRLLWCVIHVERGVAGMPRGWFNFLTKETIVIPRLGAEPGRLEQAHAALQELFASKDSRFSEWVRASTGTQRHLFELGVREADLEAINDFVQRHRPFPREAPCDEASL
jgi:predicted GIY-YIG superfamily endonuclease